MARLPTQLMIGFIRSGNFEIRRFPTHFSTEDDYSPLIRFRGDSCRCQTYRRFVAAGSSVGIIFLFEVGSRVPESASDFKTSCLMGFERGIRHTLSFRPLHVL